MSYNPHWPNCDLQTIPTDLNENYSPTVLLSVLVGAVNQTNATTITLTLASTPAGVEVLKYCYGSGFGLDPAQLVRGNDSFQMPLQVYSGSVS